MIETVKALARTLWWLCFWTAGALAAPPTQLPLSQITGQDISTRMAYYAATGGPLPANVQALATWLPQLSTLAPGKPAADRYLAVVRLHNDSVQSDWFVYPSGSVVEHIAIASYAADGPPEQVDTGYNHGGEIDFHYGASLHIAPGETRTLLLRFDSRFHFAPVRIVVAPAAQMRHQLDRENILLLLCFGVGLTLAVYNLCLFLGSRQRMYFWYASATFCYIWGWAHVFGFVEKLSGNLYPQWLMAPYLIGNAFSCLFVIDFLQLRQSSRRLRGILQGNAVLSLLVAPLAYANPGDGVLLASAATSVTLLIGLYTGIRAWRRGYRPARYFVFAYLAVLLPNMVGNLMNLGLLPGWNFNAYLAGLIGVDLDSLLLAFALADRVQWLERERKAALELAMREQAARLDAAQRHEAELSIKVDERTAELAAEVARHGGTIERLRASEVQLTKMAYHDVLTELPNRRLFHEHLARTIAQAQRRDESFALCLLDLDRFKQVNDSLGHDAGDALLVACAGRLLSNVRAADMVSRLGGDEFALILAAPVDNDAAAAILDRLLDALRVPIPYRTHAMHTAGSIGIAWFPRDGGDADAFYKAADNALYAAKDAGRDCWRSVTVGASG